MIEWGKDTSDLEVPLYSMKDCEKLIFETCIVLSINEAEPGKVRSLKRERESVSFYMNHQFLTR